MDPHVHSLTFHTINTYLAVAYRVCVGIYWNIYS